MLAPRTRSLILAVLVSLTVVRAPASDNPANATGDESAPLTDKLSKRTVWVRNKEGKPIANAIVVVDYDSKRNPPTFKTDSQGKAEVMVQQGFWGLRVDAAGVSVTIRGQIEWPCEIVLPTKKTGS